VDHQVSKKDVLQGSRRDCSRKFAAGYDDVACTLYTVSGPTFVEKIGKFLDGYRSSFRPHKKDRRTLPVH
jgi:hypothetical protein